MAKEFKNTEFITRTDGWYFNPKRSTNRWNGIGVRPIWFNDILDSGLNPDDYFISDNVIQNELIGILNLGNEHTEKPFQAVDLTQEFSEILNFVGNVAMAIRMYSPYCGDRVNPRNWNRQDGLDIGLMADVLHFFNNLHWVHKDSVENKNYDSFALECWRLIGIFKNYLENTDATIFDYSETIKIERNKEYFNLNEIIDILKRIVLKVSS